mmetsp:Transcript_96478/g.281976  ORF Transcript_96478/g.281976 Transcript_96478/m.281976 type:complete len:234 (-) Transcript_96478:400-1101(-)
MVPNVMQSMEKPMLRWTLQKPFWAPKESNSPVPVPVKASRPFTQVPRPFMHAIMLSSFFEVWVASRMFFSASCCHFFTSTWSCAFASSCSLRTVSKRSFRAFRCSFRVTRSSELLSSRLLISSSKRSRSSESEAKLFSSTLHFVCMRLYWTALWKVFAAHFLSTKSECQTRYVRPAPEIATMRASRSTELVPEICWMRSEAAGSSATIRKICASSLRSKPSPSSSTRPKSLPT